MKNNYVRLSLILSIICIVAGGILALVNNITYEKIEGIKTSESMRPEVIQAVMPGSKTFVSFDDENLIENIKSENEKFVDLKTVVDDNQNTMGYAIKTFSTIGGFGGDIEIFIGISIGGEITGVTVTTTSETPSLGTRVGEESFTSQFVGKSAKAEIDVSDIDAITGVTVSSKSFLSAVNNAIDIYCKYLGE